jgi:hypothetical protein
VIALQGLAELERFLVAPEAVQRARLSDARLDQGRIEFHRLLELHQRLVRRAAVQQQRSKIGMRCGVAWLDAQRPFERFACRIDATHACQDAAFVGQRGGGLGIDLERTGEHVEGTWHVAGACQSDAQIAQGVRMVGLQAHRRFE